MHPVLQPVMDRYQQALASMSVDDMQMHPAGNPSRWSAQQVVEHLILTYQSTSDTLADRLKKRRVTKARPTVLQWWLQLLVVSLGRFPKGTPAPEKTCPVPGRSLPSSGREMARKLTEECERMDSLLDQGRQAFHLQKVATHLVLGPMRIDQWRRFHVIHGMHHLAQIEQLKQQIANHTAKAPEPLVART